MSKHIDLIAIAILLLAAAGFHTARGTAGYIHLAKRIERGRTTMSPTYHPPIRIKSSPWT
jgi:hypothetical protein